MAKAVQNAHHDNEKIISVRCPVNTRVPLQVPNTFQNSSIPHIFLNFNPNLLNNEISADALENIKKDFADQYSYENLAAFTNNLRKFFTSKNTDERAELGKSYKKQTDIFASYMGKVFDEDISKNIESFNQKMSASYPLMLYASRYKETLGLKIIQSFDSKIYAESLSKILFLG